jgi:L-fuculose-phosphate aldolase
MHRIYNNGMTTLSGGNLSIRDEDDSIWITPAGVDKGNLEPRDIMCLKPDGQIVGPHQPSTEYPFHQEIYRRRPDVRAIVHAHYPALISFSIARIIPNTRIIPQAHHVCGEVGYAPYALPGSWQLGVNIANTFALGFDAVLLENHGIVTAGPDLLSAFQRLETLELCARTQILASSLGAAQTLTDEQIAAFEKRSTDLPTFPPQRPTSRERELRQALTRMVHRAYDRRLMTSTEGTVSARVDTGGGTIGNSFLITPYGVDRKLLSLEDLVLIQNGCAEQGKRPSRAARLHHVIYADHPDVHCIITAQCPNAMAYAVTGHPLDSRTIPESYVVLRNVPLLPYSLAYHAPEQVSAALSKKSPAVLIQNDTLLTVGTTIHQAFDRLEVADFTALSLLNAQQIGSLVPIGEAEVKDLEAKFG